MAGLHLEVYNNSYPGVLANSQILSEIRPLSSLSQWSKTASKQTDITLKQSDI